MRRVLQKLILLLMLLGLTGCVSIPEESLSQSIEVQELSEHVHFLAQPALRGRKPLSLGSRWARHYIADRFATYGLEPWGQAESYAQSFGIGTNMIGVLPGTDPNLADEVVIVSAHYDHLGKIKEGLCLGACDNASGVAVLLEMAEHLSLNPQRPKRSICFAAFDQEESALLGALAFSQRDDFDKTRIAGVINIDLLGRAGFEVLENHLFVTGATGHPALQQHLQEASPDLRILPVSAELVGARGDHVAFADLDVCTLFFSCGPYRDYHKPGDTAEKVNYQQVQAGSRTILSAVRFLADVTDPTLYKPLLCCDQTEWQNLHTCLELIKSGNEALAEPADHLLTELDKMLARESLTSKDLRSLFFNHFDPLVSLMTWPMDPCDPNLSDLEALQRYAMGWRMGLLSLDFQEALLDLGQDLAQHLNQHRSRLLSGIPDFEYRRTLLQDDYLSLMARQDQDYDLVLLPLHLSINLRPPGLLKWPPRFRLRSFIGISWSSIAMTGSQAELTDACLMQWGHAIAEEDPNAYWGRVMSQVTENVEPQSYEEWLQKRLDQTECSDEESYIRANLRSSNPHVVLAAQKRSRDLSLDQLEPVFADLLTDPNMHPAVKRVLINDIPSKVDTPLLLALARLVNDPHEERHLPFDLTDAHPLAELIHFLEERQKETRRRIQASKKLSKKFKSKPTPKTLGEYALKKLKALTRKDFGQDEQAWIRWIEQR